MLANVRGCPSLVGGRPAKSVVSNGRVGSNPTPRAKNLIREDAVICTDFDKRVIRTEAMFYQLSDFADLHS